MIGVFVLRHMTAVILAMVVVLIAAPSAHAECGLKISNLKSVNFSGHFGRGYEVFDRDQHSETAEVTIERKSGSCAFVVGFSAGSGSFAQRKLTSGATALNYQLFKDAGGRRVLKDVPSASSEEVFSGVLAAGQDSVTFQFVFIVPLLQVVPPGDYIDNVMVRVYEGSVQSAQLRDQEQLTLRAHVPTVAEFTMGDSVTFETIQSDVCVDFGELTTGETKDLKLRARSNSGYRITMQSQNGGALVNADPREGSRIAYGVEVDCQTTTLGYGLATVIQQAGLTTAAGREHTLLFRIGTVEGAASGTYRDVIVVTMYPAR